jgi:DNA integrity scanning protein DisA with diadenylate cyclase activity
MAQGQPKMKKTATTAAKQKKTKVTAVSRRQNKTTAKKGPRTFAPTKQAAAAAAHGPRAVTKAIDRKNEASIAAKAVSIGTQSF